MVITQDKYISRHKLFAHLLNRINLYPDECQPATGRLSSNYTWMAVDFLINPSETIAWVTYLSLLYNTDMAVFVFKKNTHSVMSELHLRLGYGLLMQYQLRVSRLASSFLDSLVLAVSMLYPRLSSDASALIIPPHNLHFHHADSPSELFRRHTVSPTDSSCAAES